MKSQNDTASHDELILHNLPLKHGAAIEIKKKKRRKTLDDFKNIWIIYDNSSKINYKISKQSLNWQRLCLPSVESELQVWLSSIIFKIKKNYVSCVPKFCGLKFILTQSVLSILLQKRFSSILFDVSQFKYYRCFGFEWGGSQKSNSYCQVFSHLP